MAVFASRDALKAAVISNVYARSDVEGQFDVFLAMTEELLNLGSEESDTPPLRVKEMITSTTLAAVGGAADLPEDYLEHMEIEDASTYPVRSLEYMPARQTTMNYGSGAAGNATKFRIFGNTILMTPLVTGDVEFAYVGKVPALTALEPNNDVFAAYGSLYFRGVLFHAFEWLKDDTEMVKQLKAFRSLIKGANRTSMIGQYAAANAALSGPIV